MQELYELIDEYIDNESVASWSRNQSRILMHANSYFVCEIVIYYILSIGLFYGLREVNLMYHSVPKIFGMA